MAQTEYDKNKVDPGNALDDLDQMLKDMEKARSKRSYNNSEMDMGSSFEWKCPVPACAFGVVIKVDPKNKTKKMAARLKIIEEKCGHKATHKRKENISAGIVKEDP